MWREWREEKKLWRWEQYLRKRTIFAEENNICRREGNYIFLKRITSPCRTVWQRNSRFRRIPAISWKKYSGRKFLGFSSAFGPSSCSSLWDTAGSCRIVPRSSRPEYCVHFSSISVRFRSCTEIGIILLVISWPKSWQQSLTMLLSYHWREFVWQETVPVFKYQTTRQLYALSRLMKSDAVFLLDTFDLYRVSQKSWSRCKCY